jgi:hypothetical protein
MTDQTGMRAIGAAIAQLRANPYPPEAFRWGEVLRLRVGPYQVMYTVEGDLITILRVDRRAD